MEHFSDKYFSKYLRGPELFEYPVNIYIYIYIYIYIKWYIFIFNIIAFHNYIFFI